MYFLSGSMNFFESTVLSLIISFKVSARQTKNFSEDEVTLSRNMARFGFLYHCFPPRLPLDVWFKEASLRYKIAIVSHFATFSKCGLRGVWVWRGEEEWKRMKGLFYFLLFIPLLFFLPIINPTQHRLSQNCSFRFCDLVVSEPKKYKWMIKKINK